MIPIYQNTNVSRLLQAGYPVEQVAQLTGYPIQDLNRYWGFLSTGGSSYWGMDYNMMDPTRFDPPTAPSTPTFTGGSNANGTTTTGTQGTTTTTGGTGSGATVTGAGGNTAPGAGTAGAGGTAGTVGAQNEAPVPQRYVPGSANLFRGGGMFGNWNANDPRATGNINRSGGANINRTAYTPLQIRRGLFS